MVLKSLGVAVCSVAGRDLFLAPAPAAPSSAAYATVLEGPAVLPAGAPAPQFVVGATAGAAARPADSGAGGPVWWAAAAAAAGVVGVALGSAAKTQRRAATPAESELAVSAMLEQELTGLEAAAAALAADRSSIALLAVGGEDNEVVAYAKTLPGVTQPFGFWDPIGICSGNAGLDSAELSKGRLDFYREAELKHGRVGMLASLGFFVQEGLKYHPLLNNNSSGVDALQDPALQSFFPFFFVLVGLFEVSHAAFDFDKPMDNVWNPIWSSDWSLRKQKWTVKPDKVYGMYGNLYFDPLRLMPEDPEARKDMQTRELNNGRLGMLGAAGMIAQETVTGQGTFDLPNLGPTMVAGATGVGLLWAAGLAFWDLADDKNAGYQGSNAGGAADQWKFGSDRYEGTDLGKPDARPAFDGAAYAKTLPGIYAAVAPGMKGMWDPLGFCSKSDITKEKVDFYRDAETKHGRLGMLATVGILASESYHPVGGADLDGAPAVFALGKLGMFLPAFFVAMGIIESNAMRGDFSRDQRRQWDPLNFAGDAVALEENKNTELAFGRIGMVAAIGMIAQELATNSPILSNI